MGETYIRAQVAPAAATPTLIWTVSPSKYLQESSILFCNRGGATTFRLWHRLLGAGTENKQYAFYDTPLEANRTYVVTIGVTLIATDEVYVQSASGNVSMSIFGVEVDS